MIMQASFAVRRQVWGRIHVHAPPPSSHACNYEVKILNTYVPDATKLHLRMLIIHKNLHIFLSQAKSE